MKKSYIKLLVSVCIGGVLGFAYYNFIGCKSGTCPLTGNPYISTVYGSVIGFILSIDGVVKKRKDSNKQ